MTQTTNTPAISNNADQLGLKKNTFALKMREQRNFRLGVNAEAKVSETFRVASYLPSPTRGDQQGITVLFGKECVVINSESKGEPMYVNGQWASEAYFKALTDLHTNRFMEVGVGYRVYKGEAAGLVKNFAAITASYPDKADEVGYLAPETGYILVDWEEGNFKKGLAFEAMPVAEDYDLTSKIAWNKYHFEYVQFTKHIALDVILSGNKVVIMPRITAKDEVTHKAIKDSEGFNVVDLAASSRFLNVYAQAFRLSGEEAKAYVKDQIEKYIGKKADSIMMKDARSLDLSATDVMEIAVESYVPVRILGVVERVLISDLLGKTLKVTARNSEQVMYSALVVDQKAILLLVASAANGLFSQGLRHLELI